MQESLFYNRVLFVDDNFLWDIMEGIFVKAFIMGGLFEVGLYLGGTFCGEG